MDDIREDKTYRMVTFLLLDLAVFAAITALSFFFRNHSSDPTLNIAMLYTLGIFLVTRYTEGMTHGIVFSIASVLAVNYFFTYPYWNFNFMMEGYPVAFFGMLIIAVITSVTSSRMKRQSERLLEQEKTLSRQEKLVMEGEKEKMRANLLRSVSHDLRTPLTVILGNTEAFLSTYEKLSDDERIELVEGVNQDADWLLNMVENLLAVTRIDNDKASVKKSLEAVDEIAASAVVKFKKRFPDARINVKVPDELIMTEMDAILIQQVIINILQNAKMHSESKKPMDFSIIDCGDKVEFHFRDYGKGISKDKMATLFEAGGPGPDSSSTDGYKGMGIGLSICRTIIIAHGGNICALNHEDGAEFVFWLPKEERGETDVPEDFSIDY